MVMGLALPATVIEPLFAHRSQVRLLVPVAVQVLVGSCAAATCCVAKPTHSVAKTISSPALCKSCFIGFITFSLLLQVQVGSGYEQLLGKGGSMRR